MKPDERVCRECGHADYHSADCSFFKERVSSYGPVKVLDSERVPEPAEQQHDGTIRCGCGARVKIFGVNNREARMEAHGTCKTAKAPIRGNWRDDPTFEPLHAVEPQKITKGHRAGCFCKGDDRDPRCDPNAKPITAANPTTAGDPQTIRDALKPIGLERFREEVLKGLPSSTQAGAALYSHHKDCAAFTITLDGFAKSCDCRCKCGHSKAEHIRHSEYEEHQDCAICDCERFVALAAGEPVAGESLTDAEVDAFLEAHKAIPFDAARSERIEWRFRQKLGAHWAAQGREYLDSYNKMLAEESRRTAATVGQLYSGTIKLIEGMVRAIETLALKPASAPTVESCLAELREMFPGDDVAIKVIDEAGLKRTHYWIQLNGADYTNADTLTEAMQAVREYAKEKR